MSMRELLEAAEKVKTLKDVAKEIGFPGASTVRGNSASWHKRGGYADKVLSKLQDGVKKAGWNKVKETDELSQTEVATRGKLFRSPDNKYEVSWGSSYGAEKAGNYFWAELVGEGEER